ncbi:hypothetical protein [Chitinophaga rhizosphaerae]|uniref:hypothetical protein n=1 Tax=Chitinophaga rhizosphaerae TaxID=1864947 RepID=UPI000F809EFB|nr:hypothetical protein [Chitinophaga rhizosphaerae]
MKKALILFLFIAPTVAFAQTKAVGLSAGFHSEKCLNVDLFFKLNKSRFHIGATYQFTDKEGKADRTENRVYPPGYSDIKDFFYTIDLGYSRYVWKGLNLQIVASGGEKYDYVNQGASHHVFNEKATFGGGGYVGYQYKTIEVFAGGHSLRGVGGGIRLNFGL